MHLETMVFAWASQSLYNALCTYGTTWVATQICMYFNSLGALGEPPAMLPQPMPKPPRRLVVCCRSPGQRQRLPWGAQALGAALVESLMKTYKNKMFTEALPMVQLHWGYCIYSSRTSIVHTRKNAELPMTCWARLDGMSNAKLQIRMTFLAITNWMMFLPQVVSDPHFDWTSTCAGSECCSHIYIYICIY